eukprot:SAG31_NODE_1467_length_8227_cov_7.040108_3_plen_181_part_00
MHLADCAGADTTRFWAQESPNGQDGYRYLFLQELCFLAIYICIYMIDQTTKLGQYDHPSDDNRDCELAGSQRVATVEQKRAGQKKAEAALHPELWDASDSPRRDTQMLAAFKDAAFAASAHAPRFKVQAGEALIIDNYRALHIREAYRDMDRFSWCRHRPHFFLSCCCVCAVPLPSPGAQ